MDRVDPKLLGVVLCGGRSSRMGRDKAMLETSDAGTFLQVAIDRLKSVCNEACLSAAEPYAISAHTVIDPPRSHGPISGLAASLDYAAERGFGGCLVNPVDTPHLSTDDLGLLVEAAAGKRDKIICAVAGPQARFVEPLIAVYPVAAAKLLHAAIDRRRYGLQSVIAQAGCVRVVLSPAACRNFNSPSDLSDL